MLPPRLPAKLYQAFLPWILPVVAVGLWQGLCMTGVIPTQILSAPSTVIMTAIQLTQAGELPRNLWISFERAMVGFGIGGSLGLLLGCLNGLSRPVERFTDTSMQMMNNVPFLALIPLVIIWFGVSETARIFLISAGVLFPIYINTLYGIRNADPALIEMGKIYGLRGMSLFLHIILPGALPFIFAGLRLAISYMWLSLIAAETLGGNTGIGYMGMNAREFLQTNIIVLIILLYAFLGKTSDMITGILERRWFRYLPRK